MPSAEAASRQCQQRHDSRTARACWARGGGDPLRQGGVRATVGERGRDGELEPSREGGEVIFTPPRYSIRGSPCIPYKTGAGAV